MEWVLILTMNLSPDVRGSGQVRDVAPVVLGGFTSEALCKNAGTDIALKLISLGGRHREQAGIQSNKPISSPSINTECISIQK